MKRITIQILVKNHEYAIKSTLDSIMPLNGNLVIGDLGSRDNTVQICQSYGAEVKKLSGNDYSLMRNGLKGDTIWQLYLNPGEIIKYGTEEILEAAKENSGNYHFQILRSGNLSKEIRLWTNLSFVNPVYECLVDDHVKDLNVLVCSESKDNLEERMEQVRGWKELNPTASEPYYYEACILLSQKKYDAFLSAAEQYLFRDNDKIMPITMTRYYCAMIYCYVKKDPKLAMKYILPCISAKPLMAEFWCLLGDIYFMVLKKYKKALAFYDNAMILGAKRLKSDPWPMEISKYKEYPSNMIEKIHNKIESSSYFKTN